MAKMERCVQGVLRLKGKVFHTTVASLCGSQESLNEKDDLLDMWAYKTR